MSTAPASLPEGAKQFFCAAGCFWGVEHAFRKAFPPPAIVDTKVGYMGSDINYQNPTYRQVCTGTTGHAEALEIIYDSKKVKYEQLAEFLYKMHDPCDAGGQGPDRGPQYRSVLWFDGEDKGAEEGGVTEERKAREVTRRVAEKWYGGVGRVKTELRDWRWEGERWWDAEEYHQLYLDKNPHGYECPSHFVRKFPTVLDTPIEPLDKAHV